MSFFEVHDPAFKRYVLGNAPVKRLASGFDWVEGPVWFGDAHCLLFSDIPNDRIMRWSPETGVSVYRAPSGFSNGQTRDRQGRLITCEHRGRRVTRTDLSTGKTEIIAGLYEGRPFNAPNDLSLDEKGRIYFSDPRYLGHEPIEQSVYGVYRIDPDGSIERIITDAGKPNGVAVSPDQKSLYVVSNDNGIFAIFRMPPETPVHKGRMALLAYNLGLDGTATFREVLVDYAPEDGPDGLVCDVEGNIYVAVRDLTRYGINVYSPDGKELARIPTPEVPTNVAFGHGKESKTLYVTYGGGGPDTKGTLAKIKVKKDGYHLPAVK